MDVQLIRDTGELGRCFHNKRLVFVLLMINVRISCSREVVNDYLPRWTNIKSAVRC